MKKIKILIVDDDEITREMYAEVFKKSGFEVVEAEDGLEGLDKATKDLPEVIFSGIIMPRMDGFALVEALKKNVATMNIPVVISSHMGREEDQKRADELGIKEFVVLGMQTPNEVVEKVRGLFNLVEYRLKMDSNAFDAKKMISDLHLHENLECLVCGGQLILLAKLTDISAHDFSARLVCSECGKSLK